MKVGKLFWLTMVFMGISAYFVIALIVTMIQDQINQTHAGLGHLFGLWLGITIPAIVANITATIDRHKHQDSQRRENRYE